MEVRQVRVKGDEGEDGAFVMTVEGERDGSSSLSSLLSCPGLGVRSPLGPEHVLSRSSVASSK